MKSTKAKRTNWSRVYNDLVFVANRIADAMEHEICGNQFVCNELNHAHAKDALFVFITFFGVNGGRTFNNLIWASGTLGIPYPTAKEANQFRLMALAVLIEYARLKKNRK